MQIEKREVSLNSKNNIWKINVLSLFIRMISDYLQYVEQSTHIFYFFILFLPNHWTLDPNGENLELFRN